MKRPFVTLASSLLLLTGCNQLPWQREAPAPTALSRSVPANSTVAQVGSLASSPFQALPPVGPNPLRAPLGSGVIPVAAEEPLTIARPDRLQVPTALPGADAPPIQLPAFDKTAPKDREQAIGKLFPNLPELGHDPRPDGTTTPLAPATLEELEQIAHDNSPLIRQAIADIQTANGTAIQAGTYPNPTVGYEGDNIKSGNTNGYQGGFFDQVIKTGGKLQLARALAALVDVSNAEVALRKSESDLRSAVRAGYFNVLVAQENIKISRALAEFVDEAYRAQVDMVKGGQAAAYEPLQLRVQSYQARANLLQARNRYTSAWKQLAATLGLTGLPASPIVGSIDMPVPLVRYDAALTRVLSTNSDVMTAENTLHQARINLRLANVNRIPDVDVHVAVQKDYTADPFNTTSNVAVSLPLPLWDKNRGNIMAAEGTLAHACEGPHKVRADLTQKVADAYERYDSNRQIVEYYRLRILPDQIQAYRGARARHQQEPDVVGFNDVVTAQQTLAQTVAAYVAALGAQWQAVVDLASLMEIDDLSRMGELQEVACVPNLDSLCPLPCCHPCSTLNDPRLKGGDGAWPPAAPEQSPNR